MASALNHRYPDVQGELEDEFEAEDEFEDESELEDELEDESELEDEAFLGALGGIARTVGGLLGGDREFEGEEEFEFEFEAEAAREGEDEDENEDEDEAFVNPVRRIYRDAELMAHLSRQAAATESEAEAEAFIGALVPIAARLIPRAASLVARNAPALIRGATTIARRLRRDPRSRRLVTAMPAILQRTAQSLADRSAAGRDVTPAAALRALGQVTTEVLGTPDGCRSAVHATDVFDRRYRRRARRYAAARRRPASSAGAPAYGAARVTQASGQPRRRGPAPNRAARRARRSR